MGSTAIGFEARTTRKNQLVLGKANTQVTAPNLKAFRDQAMRCCLPQLMAR